MRRHVCGGSAVVRGEHRRRQVARCIAHPHVPAESHTSYRARLETASSTTNTQQTHNKESVISSAGLSGVPLDVKRTNRQNIHDIVLL